MPVPPRRIAPLRKRSYETFADSEGKPPLPEAEARAKGKKPLTNYSRLLGLYVSQSASEAASAGQYGNASACHGAADDVVGDLSTISGNLGGIVGNVTKEWPGRPDTKTIPIVPPVGPPQLIATKNYLPNSGDVSQIHGSIGRLNTDEVQMAKKKEDGPSQTTENQGNFLAKIPFVPGGNPAGPNALPKKGTGLVWGPLGGLRGDVNGLRGYAGNISGNVTDVWGRIACSQVPWPAYLRNPGSHPSAYNAPLENDVEVRKKYWNGLEATDLPIDSPDFSLVGSVENIRGCLGLTDMAEAIDAAVKKWWDSNKEEEDLSAPFDALDCIWGNCSAISGDVSNISGNVSNIKGDVSNLNGDVSRISGTVTALRGKVSPGMWGSVSNLSGDISGLVGDVSALKGDATMVGMKNAGRVEGQVGQIPWPGVGSSKVRDKGATDASGLDPEKNPWLTIPQASEPSGAAEPPVSVPHPSAKKLLELLRKKYPVQS